MNKIKNYNLRDSANIFLWSVLAPILSGLGLSLLVSYISNIFNYDITQTMFFTLLNVMLAQIVFLVLFFVYNKVKDIDWTIATKLINKIDFRKVGISIIIGFLTLIFFYPVIAVFEYILYELGFSIENLQGSLGFDLTTIPGYLFAIFAIAFLPAVSEELLFRGVVFNGTLRSWGLLKAVVISSLVFSIIHMSPFQLLYPIILGVILAYAVYYSKSLYPAIIIHFTNNFIVITMNFVSSNFLNMDTQAEEYVPQISVTQIITALLWFTAGVYIVKHFILMLKSGKEEKKQNNGFYVPVYKMADSNKDIIINEAVIYNDKIESINKDQSLERRNNQQDKKYMIKIFILGIVLWVLSTVAFLLL
ncbi:MAG: type II CAAX prenyl endopeptidase Rce1 family protein [archaeon]